MANLTKISAPYLSDPRAPLRMGPLYAGEIIPVASPCYVAADGTVMKCITTTTGFIATVSAWTGFCISGAAAIGDPVTLFGVGTRAHICASGVVIATYYWIAATAAQIDTTAVVATDIPFAVGVSTTDIRIIRPPY